MDEPNFRIVKGEGFAEIAEKKSRFLASLKGVDSEEEALDFIGSIKKEHWKASHNCSAYIIGDKQEIQRYNDDGEPQGTAGRPMLDILLKERLTDTVVVVTRYFGGTLLGTGGLIRAYQGAVQEGLSNSELLEKRQGKRLLIEMAYSDIGKIQRILEDHEIKILDTRYTDRVEMEAVPSLSQLEPLKKELVQVTNGSILLEEKEEMELFV